MQTYLFALFMFFESSIVSNISVFKDLNVLQIGIDKTNARWADLLTLWWGNLKTKIFMLSMQNQDIGATSLYNQYQHIILGLALWHL